MSATIAQAPLGTINAAGTASQAITVSSGSAILAFAYSHNDLNYTVNSDVDGAFTQITLTNGTTGDYYQLIAYATSAWLLLNATAGAHTVSVAAGSTNTCIAVVEIALSGGDTLSLDVATAFDPMASTVNIGDITAAGASVIAGFVSAGLPGTYSGGASYGSDFVHITDATFSRHAGCEAKVVGSGGSYGANFTSTNTVNHEGICVALAITAGGGIAVGAGAIALAGLSGALHYQINMPDEA